MISAAALLSGQDSTEKNSAKQTRAPAQSEFSTVTSADRILEVRYPKALLHCKHDDGENPDVWSPEGCAADIPVCGDSAHSGNVLLCLAYPAQNFRGSNLQAAAFSVSRIENFDAAECSQKWARTNTTDVHAEKIGGLKLQAARAEQSERSHVADQRMYRVFHKSCYELDINFVTALDTAFAAEDVPRKLTHAELDQIRSALAQALAGFRFLK